MNNNYSDKFTKVAVFILIAVFSVICIGTVLIPALVAHLYGWQWLLLYPAMLILFLIYAAVTGKK